MTQARPVKTHGLTHVALAVRDPQRSAATDLRERSLLCHAEDIRHAVRAIQSAGGTIRDEGALVPGVSFPDPDGYEVEIWYELPTPVDPVRTSRRRSGRRSSPQQSRVRSS
jgi:hypothetical protein